MYMKNRFFINSVICKWQKFSQIFDIWFMVYIFPAIHINIPVFIYGRCMSQSGYHRTTLIEWMWSVLPLISFTQVNDSLNPLDGLMQKRCKSLLIHWNYSETRIPGYLCSFVPSVCPNVWPHPFLRKICFKETNDLYGLVFTCRHKIAKIDWYLIKYVQNWHKSKLLLENAGLLTTAIDSEFPVSHFTNVD